MARRPVQRTPAAVHQTHQAQAQMPGHGEHGPAQSRLVAKQGACYGAVAETWEQQPYTTQFLPYTTQPVFRAGDNTFFSPSTGFSCEQIYFYLAPIDPSTIGNWTINPSPDVDWGCYWRAFTWAAFVALTKFASWIKGVIRKWICFPKKNSSVSIHAAAPKHDIKSNPFFARWKKGVLLRLPGIFWSQLRDWKAQQRRDLWAHSLKRKQCVTPSPPHRHHRGANHGGLEPSRYPWIWFHHVSFFWNMWFVLFDHFGLVPKVMCNFVAWVFSVCYPRKTPSRAESLYFMQKKWKKRSESPKCFRVFFQMFGCTLIQTVVSTLQC